jgi:hypothetical protein
VVEKSVKDPKYPAVDWIDIWNNVKVVDDSEWKVIWKKPVWFDFLKNLSKVK